MYYAANPVHFDGTNDYLTRGGALTNVADSKLFTFSFWFRRLTAGVVGRVVYGVAGVSHRTLISVGSSNIIDVFLRNEAHTTICLVSTATPITDTKWHHWMVSVDLANVANRHAYLDGQSSLSVTTYTNDTVDFDGITDWYIGREGISSTFFFFGDMADLWMAPGTYIDLSVASNREKFRIGGAPANLGADGSAPTGSSPAVFFSGATGTWHVNLGTGSGFTPNGALTDGGLALPTRKLLITRPA